MGRFFASYRCLVALFLCGPIVASAHQEVVVEHVDDSEPGSLRWAIAAVEDGGRVVFAAELSGQTIQLTDGELVIDKAIEICGAGLDDAITISGSTSPSGSRVIYVAETATVDLNSLRIENGIVSPTAEVQDGGGIVNFGSLTIHNCRIANNQSGSPADSELDAGAGGGIANFGTLLMENSEVVSNRVGVGLHGAGNGGGILNQGSLTVIESQISDNSTLIFPEPEDGNHSMGGGIMNGGDLEISRSLISGNFCGSFGGGGIRNYGTLILQNSTISGNQIDLAGANASSTRGSAIESRYGTTSIYYSTIISNGVVAGRSNPPTPALSILERTLHLEQSVIADNSLNSAYSVADIYHAASQMTRAGVNFIGRVTDLRGFPAPPVGESRNSNGDFVGHLFVPIDPLLGPLGDFGGPTMTHQPLPGSPLIDPSGSPTESIFDQDQRGMLRIAGFTMDIGAVEVQPLPDEAPGDSDVGEDPLDETPGNGEGGETPPDEAPVDRIGSGIGVANPSEQIEPAPRIKSSIRTTWRGKRLDLRGIVQSNANRIRLSATVNGKKRAIRGGRRWIIKLPSRIVSRKKWIVVRLKVLSPNASGRPTSQRFRVRVPAQPARR